MRTASHTAGYLSLVIMLFSTLTAAQEADKAVLWPSDALSKVMRTNTPPTGNKHLLRVSGARDEIISSQAVKTT